MDVTALARAGATVSSQSLRDVAPLGVGQAASQAAMKESAAIAENAMDALLESLGDAMAALGIGRQIDITG